MKELKKVVIKLSKNYNSYESSVEREIEYNTQEERDGIVNQMFAECRRDINRQMDMPNAN